jgi:hypothetical protein
VRPVPELQSPFVYSVTLYCVDPACDAVFESEGSHDAIAVAICPFCGCTLAELSSAPVEAVTEDDANPPPLQLCAVHGPLGRRLRRRRRLKNPLRAAA